APPRITPHLARGRFETSPQVTAAAPKKIPRPGTKAHAPSTSNGQLRLLDGAGRGSIREVCLPAADRRYSLVLVRIELLLSGHHHDERGERVQYRHRITLRRQHVWQPPVGMRRLVQPTAAQDHALPAHPFRSEEHTSELQSPDHLVC